MPDVSTPLGQRGGKIKDLGSVLKLNKVVAGGAAGNFTVTGIAPGDQLLSVVMVPANAALVDLTAEFTITAANTINNTGGTASTANQLLVSYADLTR